MANNCDEYEKRCKDTLAKADDVIASQDKLLKLQDEQLQITNDALANARQGYEYYKERSEAWYRQPEFLIPVGLIAGFLIAEKVR